MLPRAEDTLLEIGPAPVLSLLVGLIHTSLYVMIRGTWRVRLPVVFPVAVLGAYAGQALGGRLGDPLRVGDFGLLTASALAWAGILTVALVGILVPGGERA